MSRSDDPQWPRLEALLDQALELSSEERGALLQSLGRDDPALVARLEALLAADAAAGSFLDDPTDLYVGGLWPASDGATDEGLPDANARIGPYRIIREIGRGGMGRVFLAERADGGFEQQVALKVTRLDRGGLDDQELVGRFLQERQILARLEHPNVARLVDGGFTADGRPYFAMEYVDGEPITRYCDRHGLDIDARLDLFSAVCDAVQYAHRHLVVHRDLKPSNALVTPDRRVKLLDFGIAKLLQDHEPEAGLTRVGGRALTPEYAAPEQVRGERVTTATDVYALGALLYELLTGRRPLQFSEQTSAAIERVICEREPERPSAVVEGVGRTQGGAAGSKGSSAVPSDEIARARGTRPDRLRRRLRGDLDTIVLRALQKDPARRYPSVDALVEDVKRHRGGLPVLARPDSTAYRARRFVARHRVEVAASALVLLSLVGGLVGSAWQARQASREAAKAREVAGFLASLFEVADPARANAAAITARELLDRGAARIETDLAGQPDVQAEMMALLGRVYRQLGLYDRARSLLVHALALRKSLYGGQHAEVAATLAELAGLSLDEGRPDEAERQHREALAIRRTRLGSDHPDVGKSLRDLATVMRRLGTYDEAERLQRDALAIHRRHYGAQHAEVASDLDGLGGILRERGELERAIVALRQALAMNHTLLGLDHLETNTVMNNLAIAVFEKGNLSEAEQLYRRVLAFDLRRLGEEHPNTATVRNNLAFVLRERGRYEEAERLYRAVLDFDRRKFPSVHPYTATVLYNLATVLGYRGQHEESERCFRESLSLFRQIYSEEHWRVRSVQGGLAAVLHAKGRMRAAEDLYRDALAGLERALPGDHPQLEPVLIGFGRLLTQEHRVAEAEPLLRRVVESRTSRLGDTDWRTAQAKVWLGICLAQQRRGDEARTLLSTSVRALRDERHHSLEVQEAQRVLAALTPAATMRR